MSTFTPKVIPLPKCAVKPGKQSVRLTSPTQWDCWTARAVRLLVDIYFNRLRGCEWKVAILADVGRMEKKVCYEIT